ncbi:hypothetical protein AB6A40_010263 [Gnathostoma spinigerum]|uniref:glucuronosyltransferase n=1 Tax=Gnathostoma spinigerum TaxID=75299 RepID=A0ABD6F172_9BILA
MHEETNVHSYIGRLNCLNAMSHHALGTALSGIFVNLSTENIVSEAYISAHTRTVGFISHGGYNSVLEAANGGVPTIVVPFFADQYRNGRAVERNGWGIVVPRAEIGQSVVPLTSALGKLLNDKRYLQRAQRISRLIKTKPFSAKQKLLKYIRFVADNDGELPELMLEGRNLNFFILHSLDIIVPFVVVVIVTLFVLLRCMLALHVTLMSIMNKLGTGKGKVS